MRLRTVDLDGLMYFADFGGEGPPHVLVHGLGGSHLNWFGVGAKLATHGRVLAPDLPGFGLSPPGKLSGVEAIQKSLIRFITDVVGQPVVLVGNSMGGLLSMMVAAERPELVEKLVLVGPAQPIPSRLELDPVTVASFLAYWVPGLGDYFVARTSRRLGPEGLVRRTLGRCVVDISRVSPELIEHHVALATRRAVEAPWAQEVFLKTARSVLGMVVFRADHVYRAVEHLRADTLIIHGRHDRLVPVSASIALAKQHPKLNLVVMEDAGHTPQIEHPDEFVEIVSRWVTRTPLRAAG